MNYPKNRYSGKSPWLNKEWLYNEYIVKDRSSFDIASEYGCKQVTITTMISRYGFKKESVKRTIHNPNPYQTKDYLLAEYSEKKRSVSSIAKEHGVSDDAVRHFIDKYGIPHNATKSQRNLTEQEQDEIALLYIRDGKSTVELAKQFHTTRVLVRKIIKEHGFSTRDLSKAQFVHNQKNYIEELDDTEFLERLHWKDNLSCKQIGDILGCEPGTVRRHMRSLGIKTRNNSESKVGLMCGEKHHNWKGGITPLNMRLREYFQVHLVPKIGERDNYTCQECGAKHTTLNVHHIYKFSDILRDILEEHPSLDPNNEDDRDSLYSIAIEDKRFLDEDNLITLCKKCHMKKHSKTISNQADNSEGSETIQ